MNIKLLMQVFGINKLKSMQHFYFHNTCISLPSQQSISRAEDQEGVNAAQ